MKPAQLITIGFFYLVALAGGYVGGGVANSKAIKQDAIKQGYAMYDAVSGSWRWKDATEVAQTVAIDGKLPMMETTTMVDFQLPVESTPAPVTKKFRK